MKNFSVITLTMALSFIFEASFSQVNSYFQNNPVWTVRSSCRVSNSCCRTELTNYYINGDTLINGFIYKKLYEKYQGSNAYCYTGGSGSNPTCTGSFYFVDTTASYFLRSQAKKIFIRQPTGASESLLYDFNLLVGDTLPATFNNSSLNSPTVMSIDSISTPYGYRKRFALIDLNYLVEGIGHSHGWVDYLGNILDCGFSSLDCFSLKDTAYYPSAGPTCNLAVGIVSYEKKTSVLVFPNPFSAFTTLYFSSILNGAQLNIYNHFGQISKTLKEISGDKIRIERGTLTSGIYIYELMQDSKSTVVGKLIITD